MSTSDSRGIAKHGFEVCHDNPNGISPKNNDHTGITDSVDSHQMALVNSRARLRMTTLYYHAQLNNYLVAGTGNKVEDFGIGFYTKYGDGGVD